MNGETLRVALPHSAELPELLDCLRSVGWELSDEILGGIHRLEDQWDLGFDLEVFVLAPTDVGVYVEHGISHFGVMSTDTLRETDVDVWRPYTFAFGGYPLVLAARKHKSLQQLIGEPTLRLATTLPNYTREWFSNRGIEIEVVAVRENPETACLLGLTDAYVDRLVDNARLESQGFKVVETLDHTRVKLVVNNACGSKRRAAIWKIIKSLEEVRPATLTG